MRLRGFIVFLVGLPLAVYLNHYNEVKVSEFYEFGSVAAPAPLWFRGAGLLALVLMVTGIYLLLLDFTRWVRRRLNERIN
jgi:hypothetical protein